MGTIRGIVLDASLNKIAKNLIDIEKSGLSIDINSTLENWNNLHKLVTPENLSRLQNDVALFIELEKNRELKSISAIGYGSYLAEPYAQKAKELMSVPFQQEPQNS